MQKIRDNLATIVAGIVIAALFVASVALVAHRTSHGGALVVAVHDGDGGTLRFPLSEDGTHTFSTSLGSNTIAIRDGEVRMVEADCPNGDCLRQRPVSQPGQQLICLPHRLWVEVVPQGNVGGSAMDADAVAYDTPSDAPDVDLVAR